ncbi:hypothetical protein Nepgr_013378 [Nepenthes gracilis]|uniref:Uncharacterized protein n=1 Tax=Nepenthes gracilis TaxID=150966 RepID=A0AAD3SJ20_NEPGR|nr:hypothetical protein Nepgr_013378 [Nepenthes gracilis]
MAEEEKRRKERRERSPTREAAADRPPEFGSGKADEVQWGDGTLSVIGSYAWQEGGGIGAAGRFTHRGVNGDVWW